MIDILRPIAQEIRYQDPVRYFLSLPQHDGVVFFDSAKQHGALSRYSYIALNPFDSLICPHTDTATDLVFSQIEQKLAQFTCKPLPGLPPFQAGAAGFLSYDCARDIERLPQRAQADPAYPVLCLGFYNIILSFDHQCKKAWLVVSGDNAPSRMKQLLAQLSDQKHTQTPHIITDPLIPDSAIQSDMSANDYQRAVSRVIQYIKQGDIFEANLSQRFQATLPSSVSPIELYKRLRHLNPAPFSGYAQFDNTCIISSSPERFLQLNKGAVETRPIKGTIKRATNPIEDQQLAQQLLDSEKDRAENIMIVDLMRNDLSRVCEPDSVIVPQLCGLESYETVHHLVSVVQGTLKKECHVIDLLRASFPGGSITGAPKVRAMEIIETLEPTRRGPYCGSLLHIGFDGCMDSSILIRSYVIHNKHISFQGGGAVVLDSDPTSEYLETLTKVATLRAALSGKLSIKEQAT
jgi:para-aminobenzoate synthetase component I